MTGDDQKYNYVIKIGETIANFFSSLALAIASFQVIISFISLMDDDGILNIQGNKVTLISILDLSLSVFLSFFFLSLACLILYFLREERSA